MRDERLGREHATEFVVELGAGLAVERGAQDHDMAVPRLGDKPAHRVYIMIAAAHQQQTARNRRGGGAGWIAFEIDLERPRARRVCGGKHNARQGHRRDP